MQTEFLAHIQPHSQCEHEETSRPTIGCPLHIQSLVAQGPVLCTDASCAWAVELLGEQLLFVPLWPFSLPSQPYAALWPLLSTLDGLLLATARTEEQGGADDWLRALVQLASFVGLPILALGEHAGTWNAALGGSSARPEHASQPPVPPHRWPRSAIRAGTGSLLTRGLRQTARAWELPIPPGLVIDQLAPGLWTCASTPNGQSIAFERRDGAFGLGMLARLDWGLDQPMSAQVFTLFLQAARRFASWRAQHANWQSVAEHTCTTLAASVAASRPLLTVREALVERSQSSFNPAGHESFLHSEEALSSSRRSLQETPKKRGEQ